jgi:prepilin-type N-terminal cleavage/methylation domain-containing protein
MNPKLVFNKKGITLIELLVALVICGIIVAGIYRVFITQSKAYIVQDQAVEVQQNIRSAMEIMLRDLRMTGYKNDLTAVTLVTPIFPGDATLAVRNDAIRVEYENNGNLNAVVYSRNAISQQLQRELFVNGNPDANNPEVLLENVDTLRFSYGVDGIVGFDVTQDGSMDDRNGDGIIDDNDWVDAATVNGGNLNVIAIRVVLTARPSPVNPDVQNIVVPRTLVSTVTLRNLCLIK